MPFYNFITLFIMRLPKKIYQWLVSQHFIPNTGQLNQQAQVQIPDTIRDSFLNGYLIAKILQKIAQRKISSPSKMLVSVRNDNSKGVKSTNWNLLWLSFQSLNLKFDTRIKQLILQGEHALIVEILKQLYDHSADKDSHTEIVVKTKLNAKNQTAGLNVKNVDLSKNPQQSKNPLEFLILLLKTSLNMNLDNILSLFTNQNKYLAHIIVKGINENFDPIILFYSLLNKHYQKLVQLLSLSQNDAAACLYAIKPGFISKSGRVAELTLQLFSRLQNIYTWFVSTESRCINTFFLGYTRHENIRADFWNLLLYLVQKNIVQFFTEQYNKFTQRLDQLISVTTLIINRIAHSKQKQILIESGTITKWLQITHKLSQTDIDSQIIAFNFVAELMLYLPQAIKQNDWCLSILTKNWKSRSLIHFIILFNQLINILERLGEYKNSNARQVYMDIVVIFKSLPKGEKRDYVLENFARTVTKFPTIPSQNIISNLRNGYITSCQFQLICQAIEATQNTITLFQIGRFMKDLFLQSPLLNHYSITILKEIIEKLQAKKEKVSDFIISLLSETLHHYSQIELKYKHKLISQASIIFGSSQNINKLSNEEQQLLKIKLKQKELYFILINYCAEIAIKSGQKQLTNPVSNLLLKTNTFIKQHNNKIGSKQLQSLLNIGFQIPQQHIKNMDQSRLKQSVTSRASPKPIQKIPKSEQLKFQTEKKKFINEKQYSDLQKLKSNIEFQLANLYHNQLTDSTLAQDGFLELFVNIQEKAQITPRTQMDDRDAQAIQVIFSKNHRVLQNLFDTYSGIAYSGQGSGLMEQNVKRKEFLNVVQLTKLLKDYKKFYLTSQAQINKTVKQINLKIMNKRNLHQLDFCGFQQYIIQFCINNMTLPHQIKTTITTTKAYSSKAIKQETQNNTKTLKGQPLSAILQEFFKELKESFASRGQSIALFQDTEDIILNSQQATQIQSYNKTLLRNPDYILPKGYKKITENVVTHSYQLSNHIQKIPQAYDVVISVIDEILSQSLLGLHIVENIAEKKIIYRARPITYNIRGQQKIRQRVMSTTLDNKSSAFNHSIQSSVVILQPSMRAALKLISPKDKVIGQQVAQLLEQILGKINPVTQKEKLKTQRISAPKRKSTSNAKILEIEKKYFQKKQLKSKQKQQAAIEAQRIKKEQQLKRRQQIQKFLENQKQKLLLKRKRDEDMKELQQQKQRQNQALKKLNMEKFKVFHEDQYKKIKKIEQEALQMKRRQQSQKIQNQERQERQRLIRAEKIKEQSKITIQIRKEVQKNMVNLFMSEQIKSELQKYQANLKALFDFLIGVTHKSLSQKTHNNQIVVETWKYFNNSFQLSPLFITPQEVVSIFKYFTRTKLVAKQYFPGLTFKEFQQALFRIAVKGKSYFNHISKRIKEPASQKIKSLQEQNQENKQKQSNQFEGDLQLNLKELQQQNRQGKTQTDQFGDLSKVSSDTIRGLIYYLRVPNFKQGQNQRFRAILSKKLQTKVSTQQKLKQKLSEYYDLSPKKKVNQFSEKKSKLKSMLSAKLTS